MSINGSVDIKRLEKQMYMHNPSLHRFSEVGKDRIRKKLHNQLQLSRPQVSLEKYHVHKLLVNIGKNFQKCKDFGIIQTSNEAYEDFQKRNQLMDLKAAQLSEQSDDDDDIIKPVAITKKSMIFSPDQTPRSDCDDNLPLAIRKEPRKRLYERTNEEYETPHSQSSNASSRKRSFTILPNAASEHEQINKSDSVDTQVTLTISLPSILRESTDNNLEISVDFGKIDLARQVLDQRIRRLSDNETNNSNSKTNYALANNQNAQQIHAEKEVATDEALSCLISEVLVEPNSSETWRATAALENINNNVGDNYNSNFGVQRGLSVGMEAIPSAQPPADGIKKKQRKRTIKANSSVQPKGPPKKRGRKPGQKNAEKKLDCEKSDLARYVELFSNNCELSCTTTSTPMSSNMSQMVTSTTQNYEEPVRTANETQTAQISYLINGEWTNGGICQLISSGNVGNIGLDTGHISQEDFSLNTPFEDFVNYIDSSNNDVGNNEIARVLDANNIAVPSTCSNLIDLSTILPINQGSLVDNLRKISNSAYIANVQKTKKNIPPPAHNIEGGGILDLSLKPDLFSSVVIEEEKEALTNNCEPMDLSMKTKNDENQLQSSLQLIQGEEESDDVFLRRLIDNSDFDYKDDNSNQNCNSTERNDLLFEPILDANVSFKAALDMPLLDNDESNLAFKQNSAEIQESDKQQKRLDDFTQNFEDNHHIIESTQNNVIDLKTPPRLTFIQTQDSTNLLQTQENDQILTQDEIKNLVLADIVHVENDNKKSILNKTSDDPGTPPIMSLIPKTDDFSNTTLSRTNEEVFKDRTNILNLTTLDTNKNTNEAENLIKQLHLQSVDINIVPNADKRTPDIDIALSNSVTKEDATETNDTQMTKIQEVLKNNNFIEDLSSKNDDNDASNGIASLKNNSNANNIVKSHAKDLLDIENETEVNKDNDQTIDKDISITKTEPTVNEFIQNAKQANDDCADAYRIYRVQESENINIESIQIAKECTKLETDNYTLPETHPKLLQYTSADNENEATQSDIQPSINVNSSIEKTFIANVKEYIEVECNKHHLLEVQPENISSINKGECDKMDIIINDSIDELSHNIAANNADEKIDNSLLEVMLEKNVTQGPIEENRKKEIENNIIENVGSVKFPETQVASYNLSPLGKIVTEIEDVNSLLCNENEEKKIFKSNETSEFKQQKSASKLQIISVVSIDSFTHTHEDDNEFIRRTLNSHENRQNTEMLKNQKFLLISNNEDGNETKNNINISDENSNIKKEEIAKSIEECKNNTHHESVAVVPEEVKKIFDQVIDIKSETIEVIDIKNTLINSKTKQTETKALNSSLENTELKTEPNNDTEQPDNTLDVIKEESNIIDLSLSCKNNEIILTEPPTEDTKSLDLAIEIKQYKLMDEITDLSVRDGKSEENNVCCDKETTKSEIASEYIPVSCHGDEPKCSTLAQNQPVPVEDSSPITIFKESNDTSEDLTENNSSNDKRQELAVEQMNTIEQTKEKNHLIMTTIPKDVLSHNHKNNLFLSNLSLLEMEEKFDESLDFDNHLEDDVLSLATSCFNSPIDDRFGNSIVVDEPNDADIKPIFVNTTGDDPPPKPEFVEVIVRPQMKEELNEPEEKDFPIDPISTLSKFKIPKLGAAKMKQFIQQTNEAPTTKRIELDKITRTVQNVCAVPPLPLQPPAMCSIANTSMLAQRKHDLFSNATGNGISCVITLDQKVDCESFAKDILVHNNPNYMNISRGQFAGRGGEAINSGAAVLDIAKIFGPTCLPFLVDKCSVLGNGQHNHQLRDGAFVQMALEGLPKTELNTAYKFMFNHSKLFRRYFYVFCSVYSKHNNRSKLLNMVYDCEKQTGCVPLLRNIFYSLIECGLNKINACRQILSRSRDKSSTTIDVLVGIIFEADWGMFCDYLERFAQMPHYSFRINLLSEMAARVLRTKDTRLSSVVCKCLLTLNQDDYKLVNRTPNLIALLELMKDGKVC